MGAGIVVCEDCGSVGEPIVKQTVPDPRIVLHYPKVILFCHWCWSPNVGAWREEETISEN